MDSNNNGSISINEFFDIIDVLEEDSQFSIPIFPDSLIWEHLRNFLNHHLKFKAIANSPWFDLLMFLIVIANCGIVLALMILDDGSTFEKLDEIEGYFIYSYIIECLIKVIGFGISKYF